MAKDKKDHTMKSQPKSAPSFEDSLAELQEIVADLEDGTLGLEASMLRFEKGIDLLRGCYHTLEQAEQKIEILTGTTPSGEPLTEPFDASATAEGSKPSAGRRRRSKSKGKTETPQDSDENDDSPETLF